MVGRIEKPEHRWAVAKMRERSLCKTRTLERRESDMSFGLRGLQSQNLTISVDGVVTKKIALTGGAEPVPCSLEPWIWSRGRTRS